MTVGELMTASPAFCTPDTSLQEVARTMVENDCGCIPVLDSEETKKPIGVITDRDICCRTVAEGKNPLKMTAGDCMSSPAVTVARHTAVEECCTLMEEKQVRRAPVLDEQGACCGMVSQADIAQHAPARETAEVLREISKASASASKV